jgi:hypothetical protein
MTLSHQVHAVPCSSVDEAVDDRHSELKRWLSRPCFVGIAIRRAVTVREPARNFAYRDAVYLFVATMDGCARLAHLGC